MIIPTASAANRGVCSSRLCMSQSSLASSRSASSVLSSSSSLTGLLIPTHSSLSTISYNSSQSEASAPNGLIEILKSAGEVAVGTLCLIAMFFYGRLVGPHILKTS